MVADPDALAELPVIRAHAPGEAHLECEDTLYIAARAHRAVTGEELPPHSIPIPYRELDPAWDFDFDDRAEMKRRLPRLATLFLTDVACWEIGDRPVLLAPSRYRRNRSERLAPARSADALNAALTRLACSARPGPIVTG